MPSFHPNLKPSSLFWECYKIGELIREGASGSVHKCTRIADGQDFAVKIMNVYNEDACLTDGLNSKEMALREIETLQKVAGHKNVIELISAFDMGTEFLLVFELCLDGDLLDFMDRHQAVPQETAFQILKQILAALEHCHKLGIVHRDVKSENILIDKELNVKLTDFGLARELKQGEYLTQHCGTRGYFAPEMLLAENEQSQGYNFQVDTYACGVILYTLLCGLEPFDCGVDATYRRQVLTGDYFPLSGPEWKGVSEKAKCLVAGLLEPDPELRVSLADCIQSLEGSQ